MAGESNGLLTILRSNCVRFEHPWQDVIMAKIYYVFQNTFECSLIRSWCGTVKIREILSILSHYILIF